MYTIYKGVVDFYSSANFGRLTTRPSLVVTGAIPAGVGGLVSADGEG